MNGPGVIAVTGLRTHVGKRLVERLLGDGARRLIGLDRRRPYRLDERVTFRRIDLVAPAADAQIAALLEEERVEALVHCAFRSDPTPDTELDYELETIGSRNVMTACAAARVRRIVLASSTMVYGPRRDNPNFLTEDHPLRGHPDAHCVQNRVEVESDLQGWLRSHPEAEVTVLRPCWMLGPRHRDGGVRYLTLPVVPTVMGFDPLLQFVHEDDVIHAFERATLAPHPGVFNVVGRGVLPLSMALRLAGRRRVPLPTPLLYRASAAPARAQTGDAPAGFYDYLRYLWVADGERGWEAFGEPSYSAKEAWISAVSALRMRHYA